MSNGLRLGFALPTYTVLDTALARGLPIPPTAQAPRKPMRIRRLLRGTRVGSVAPDSRPVRIDGPERYVEFREAVDGPSVTPANWRPSFDGNVASWQCPDGSIGTTVCIATPRGPRYCTTIDDAPATHDPVIGAIRDTVVAASAVQDLARASRDLAHQRDGVLLLEPVDEVPAVLGRCVW